jgi:hypothetical protein
MRPWLQNLKTVVKHPSTQLVCGLILFLSGMAEIGYDFFSAERTFRLGVHHGVALFGLVQMLGSLPDLVDGLERSFRVWEQPQEQKNHGPSSSRQTFLGG